jgi:hypothetical protein
MVEPGSAMADALQSLKQTSGTAAIGGGGYSADEKLAFLKELMPDLKALEMAPGVWKVTSRHPMTIERDGVSHLPMFQGATREAAIDDAFAKLTTGGPLLTRGSPSGADRVEVSWAGNGWNFSVRPSGEPTGQVGESSAKHRALLGDAHREKVPTTTVIGRVHSGERPESPAGQLLDKGFAADGMPGGHEKALRLYRDAFEAFRDEVLAAHGAKLVEAGVDAQRLLAIDDPIRFCIVARPVIEADAEFSTLAKKLLNRTGLALKHRADALAAKSPTEAIEEYTMAMIHCQQATHIDPGYGAAHYNMACIHWRGFGDANSALDALKTAIADKSYDFAKQAREKDTDWNPMRNDPEFRNLVGLPKL